MSDPLHDPFGRVRLPPAHDQAARARMLAQFARDVLAGRHPDRATMAFIAAALDTWIRSGSRAGDLERLHLGVRPRRGSHLTCAALLERHRDERQDDAGPAHCIDEPLEHDE